MEKTVSQIHFTNIEGINHFSSDLWSYRGGMRVDKEMIAAFADVTGNHQWIHEPHENVPGDPYNGQIAHGLLLLSLIPTLLGNGAFEIVGHNVRIIRGFERVRFTHPVHPGEFVHLNARRINAHAAKSGKGTVVEQEIVLWIGDVITWTEEVLVCTLKLQYF